MAAATHWLVRARTSPMAKRRSREVFSGPCPVRMRSRSSSKALSRTLWRASTVQCPRLRARSRCGSADCGEWLVTPKARSTEVFPDFLKATVRSTRKACPTWGKSRWSLSFSVVQMARLSRRPCSRERGSRKSGRRRSAKAVWRSSRRLGWLALAAKTKCAPRRCRKRASLRWVRRASAVKVLPARSASRPSSRGTTMPISLVRLVSSSAPTGRRWTFFG